MSVPEGLKSNIKAALKLIVGAIIAFIYLMIIGVVYCLFQDADAIDISDGALAGIMVASVVLSFFTTRFLSKRIGAALNSFEFPLFSKPSGRLPIRTARPASSASPTYAGSVFSSLTYSYGNELLERARHSAEIINTTTDIKRFVNAYTTMETAMTQLIELNESGKMKMTPTPREHLNGIRANIAATINDFIDRAVGTMPIDEAARSEILEPFLDELEANETISQMMTAENYSKIKLLRADLVHETYVARQLRRIDCMEGHAFEYWCADLLRVNGFTEVSVTRGSGDQGVDVLAEKDGIRYAIQCKCYSSNLGNSPVQEVYAGKEIYDCHLGAVMTNREFTSGAIELANKNRVLLWGRAKLVEFLEQAEKADTVLV